MPTLEPPRDDESKDRQASDLSISAASLKQYLAKAQENEKPKPKNSAKASEAPVNYKREDLRELHPDDIVALKDWETLVNQLNQNTPISEIKQMLLEVQRQCVAAKRMWINATLKLDAAKNPNYKPGDQGASN